MLLVKVILDVTNDDFRVNHRVVILDHLAFLIYQEFGPVPGYFLAPFLFTIVQLRVQTEVLPDVAAVFTVNFNFLRKVKLDPELAICVLLYFVGAPRLLIIKLIAWKSNDLQALFFKLLMYLNQL